MSASAPRTFLMLRNGKQIMRRQTCIVLEWNLAGFDLPTHTHTHLSRCPDRDTDIELEKEWLGYSSWLHCEPFFPLERAACETLERSGRGVRRPLYLCVRGDFGKLSKI